MLDPAFERKLWNDFKREADFASARGAAEQIGKLSEFDASFDGQSDPWDLVRSLLDTTEAK